MLLEIILSRHSTPIDQKIQKDWAEVMQQFGLPDDNQTSQTVTKDVVAPNGVKPKKGFKFMLAFAGTLALTVAGLSSTGSIDLAPLQALKSVNLDEFLSSTTTASIVKTAKPLPVKQSSVTKPQTAKPQYITLTKELDLSALQTLSAKDDTLDYDLLNESDWNTYIVPSNASLNSIFHKLGINKSEVKELSANSSIYKELDKVSSGYILRAKKTDGKLQKLITYQPNSKSSFVISYNDKKYTGQLKRKVIETRETRATLYISNSLRYDANQENIPLKVINKLTKIFDRDVKLTRDLKKGDRMTLVYEQVFHRGNKIADGQILAAELLHKKRSHRAIKFVHTDGKVDYLDAKGYDLSLAFIRNPLSSYKKISSGFGKRRHPIYKRIRMHTGVDYAARTGTPVKATGNGVAHHVARKGGYGKTVIIKHTGGYSTLYGHLSKYAKDLKPGTKVYMGDTIGFVGSTGRSTGPHLHYEFRVNGVPKNPVKVELPKQLSLNSSERSKFKQDSHNLIRQLDVLQRFAEEKVDIKSGFGG